VVNAIEYQSDCYVGRFAEGDSGLQDVSRLTLDDRMDLGPTWLPDGKAILFTSDRDGSPDVFRQSLESSEAEPLITGPGTQRNARVSPDGAWILYEDFPIASAKSAAAAPRLMRMPIGGGPSERVLAMQPTSTYRCARSPASLCVMSEVNDASMVFTAFDPVRGRGREVSRQAVGVAATTPPPWDLSPDGSALAVVVSQDTLPHLRLLSLRNAPPRDIRLDRKVAIQDIAWAADGKSWLAVAWVGKGEWNLLRIAPDGRTHAMIPSQLWMYEVAPAADGRHVAYTSNTGQGNLWLLEGI
jgi:dipeptidyl aminopeptidase/acylaminoacyl peptidase